MKTTLSGDDFCTWRTLTRAQVPESADEGASSQTDSGNRYRGLMLLSRRPFGVTLLLWMVLSLLAWGLVRLVAALRWWDVLYEFKASLSPLYLSITGAGWGVAGAVLLWSLWSGKAWSPLAILSSVLLWLTEYWIERLFFQLPRSNLLFSLAISALLMALTSASALNRNTKNFFTKSEEHEQSNESSAPS